MLQAIDNQNNEVRECLCVRKYTVKPIGIKDMMSTSYYIFLSNVSGGGKKNIYIYMRERIIKVAKCYKLVNLVEVYMEFLVFFMRLFCKFETILKKFRKRELVSFLP